MYRKADVRLDFNEYFSNFKSVKHNDWFTLFLFYGVMKYVQDQLIGLAVFYLRKQWSLGCLPSIHDGRLRV